MPYPDRFYPVVDSLKWVERLTKLGVGTIQLRAKDLDDSQALQIVTDALAITNGTQAKLVVNDYWRAAVVAGAKYLHLGQEDLADADLKSIREAGLSLGVSTHDDAELETALAAKPDYVALGPIFFTTLKSMRFEPQGIPKITEWKKRIGTIPLVAIGGIKFEHAAEIFAAGADSIAVVVRRHPERRPGRPRAAMARPARRRRDAPRSLHSSLRGALATKQSRLSPQRASLDCFAALAMTEQEFTSVAQTHTQQN